jgi:hypothetical protein
MPVWQRRGAYLLVVERTAHRAQPVLSVPRSARAAPRHARARVASPGVTRLSLVRHDGRD